MSRNKNNHVSKPHHKKRGRVTVVIPVLNESRTISSIVRFANSNSLVKEVIVLDDGSIDGTPELATAAGARVIISSFLGKGASMEEGLQASKTEFLFYLDGDLSGLKGDLIDDMLRPLLSSEADFVKAKFTRSAGRVTLLTAKPLLMTYFPELAQLAQPLGGIIAARKDLLERLRFENDYGVDVGILIDAVRERARIVEVDIGELKHDSQNLEDLSEMAMQVARTILERAGEWGRLRLSYLRASKERVRTLRGDYGQALKMLKGADRLALLDMDGTLLNGRFVLQLAQQVGKMEALNPLLDNQLISPAVRARKIAALFKGVPKATIEQVARSIPLMPGAVEMVVGLRKLGFLVGIITDSYRLAAEMVRRRVFADFSLANMLRFKGEKATGGLTICPLMRHAQGCRRHSICKFNALKNLLDEVPFGPENILAVGDSENDVCLLKAAGNSVAFNPKSAAVQSAAKHVLEGDLRALLKWVGGTVPRFPELRDPPAVDFSV